MEIPLNRPSAFAKPAADKSGPFSPTGGEGWDEGVRFMRSVHFFLKCIVTMNPMLRVRGPGLQVVGPVPLPGWFEVGCRAKIPIANLGAE
jgi:hypothetical protein